IVLYDDSALRSSARTWHLLRSMGFVNVAILDGGLSKWREEQRELGAGDVSDGISLTGGKETSPAFLNKADMLRELDAPTAQILDARAADRVFGTGTDPVHAGANGRIPGSLNLPFNHVFNADGTYKSPESLRLALETAGLDLARPVITSCGSGITASVLLFALHSVGVDDALLYDGSWAEWSADPNTPKAQGPA
ncbi:MAG: rhodanese-like domain-containing protein, partial [Marinomonas sp.]